MNVLERIPQMGKEAPLSSLLQYAFLVTAAVQFAGGIIIFFGLLVSPEEIGEEKRPFCSEHLTVMVRPARPGSCSLGEL